MSAAFAAAGGVKGKPQATPTPSAAPVATSSTTSSSTSTTSGVAPTPSGDQIQPSPTPVSGGTPPVTILSNTEKDVLTTATNLSAAASYSPSGTPTPTSDVTFTSSTYTGTTFGTSTNSLSMGTLNDLDATQSLLITNNSTTTNRTITLNGGGDAVSGSASTDLIFLASSTNLTIQDGTTNTLGLVLAADGDFHIGSGASLSISSILSAAFNLTKTGTGTLTLSGVNTFGAAKTFTLAGGTLNINSTKALGSATNTFQINGGTTIDNTSGAAITLANNQPLTINGDFAMTGAADTTHDLNLGTGAVSLGTSAGTARQITVNSAGTLTIGGVISNGTTATSITKAGTGTLVLNGADLFTGGVTINAGTVTAGSTTALGPAANATLTFGAGSTGKFQLNGKNTTVIDLNTNATVGTPVIENSNATNATLTVNTANTDTYAGVLQDGTAGTLALTKSGTGSLTLSGTNTYTGTTTVSAGTLQISGGSAIADSGLVTLGTVTANTFDVQSDEIIGALSGGSATIGVVNLATGKTLTLSSGTQTYSGTFSGTGTLKVDGATETIASAVTLNAITLSSGTLTLSSANTITNGLTISGGTVNIGNNNALGTGTLTINGGTLQSTSGTGRTLGVTQINVGGDFIIGGTNTGALTFTAPVDLGGATRQITDNNTTNSTTFSGVISNGGLTKLGNGELDLTGTANNIYSGLTTVTAGTLGLGKNAGVDAFEGDLLINGGTVNYSAANNNQIPDASNVTMTSGAFDLGARTETINSLTMSGGTLTKASNALTLASASSITGGTVSFTSAVSRINTTGTLTLGGATFNYTNASDSTEGLVLGGDITYASTQTAAATFNNTLAGVGRLNLNSATRTFNIADSTTLASGTPEVQIAWSVQNGALTKTGTGALLLSGTNTYTGATTVSGGTLFVNGSLASGSAVTVSGSGTVLGGAGGTINGTISVGSGAILQGGTGSTGQTLTLTGAVSMGSGSIVQLALSSSASSTLTVSGSGSLSLQSNQQFAFIDLGAVTNHTYTLATGMTQSNSFDVSGFTINQTIDPNWAGTFSYSGGTLSLNLSTVPEPSTYAAAALAFAALCYNQRRRFKRALKKA